MSGSIVEGIVAPGFEGIVEAFQVNLATGEDLGAQFAIQRDGELLVDLRGGRTASGEAYPDGALHPLFSVTKGVSAGVVGLLIDEGALDLDLPVAHYWPEFGVAGKSSITVAQLLAHQAGIPGLDEPIATEELLDHAAMAARFAARAPIWEPGTAHGYHALAIGYLVGELVRRITGASLGTILAERIAGPRGLDLWIGLPPEQEARVTDNAPPLVSPSLGGGFGDAVSTPGSPTWLAFGNPPVDSSMFNDHRLLEVEIPSANGVANARSLAAYYAGLVTDDAPIVSRPTIDRMRRRVTTGIDRVIVDVPTRYGALFMLGAPVEPMLGPSSFGHNGFGGSLAFADPVTGVGVAYLSNLPVLGTNPFPKVTRLLEATRSALEAQRG